MARQRTLAPAVPACAMLHYRIACLRSRVRGRGSARARAAHALAAEYPHRADANAAQRTDAATPAEVAVQRSTLAGVARGCSSTRVWRVAVKRSSRRECTGGLRLSSAGAGARQG